MDVRYCKWNKDIDIDSRNPSDETPTFYEENEYPVIESPGENTDIHFSRAIVNEMPPPTCSLFPKRTTHSSMRDTAVSSIDYKKVWMANDIPTVTVHIETGQLLKGDDIFMK